MDGLKWLCDCCICKCEKEEIEIKEENGCKVIKCLNFQRDITKIKPPEPFAYVVRSDEQ